MNYTPLNCYNVLTRLKDQTRRAFHEGERAIYEGGEIVKVLDRNGRKKWAVGDKMAAAPGRGKFACGRTDLVGIRLQYLNEITEADAQAEGADQEWVARLENGVFVNGPSYRAGFFTLWDGINKSPRLRSNRNPRVWALTMGPEVELFLDRFAELERQVEPILAFAGWVDKTAVAEYIAEQSSLDIPLLLGEIVEE